MRRNNRRLFRAARGIIGSDWEAEEVVQDSYVRAFRAPWRFPRRGRTRRLVDAHHNQRGTMRGRLETLPLTELDDKAKTMGEIIQFPGANSNTDPERQAAIREICTLLERAIDALPSAFREVFVLRHVEGLSTEETAEALSIGDRQTRLHRARTRLQEALQDQLAPALKDTFPFQGERCLG
jgi:RNA polymerase sigma-70 factor (ECF subfamily)